MYNEFIFYLIEDDFVNIFWLCLINIYYMYVFKGIFDKIKLK